MVATDAEQHMFEVQIYLNDLDPSAVRVELYADGTKASGPRRQEMKRIRPLVGAASGFVYSAAVPATCPALDCTARVVPHFAGVAVPFEDAQIL